VIGSLSPTRSIRALEEEIRRHFGVRHVFLVSSGKAALTLTLMALKSLSDKTEVVIPAYTCFSVPAAVLKAGLRPVLCDINASTFDFDHALLEQTLGPKTLCVVGHHLFGVPSDIERLRALCHARGIFVAEDAAQAMGVTWKGRHLGTLGDVGIFSLGRGKNITCGSGGIIVTNSNRMAKAVSSQYRKLGISAVAELADFVKLVVMAIFIRPRLYWIPSAVPALRLGETIFPKDIRLMRLSGLKAGLLRNWRTRLAQANQVRSDTAAYFSRRLTLTLAPGASHPYLRLPIFVATPAERACSLSTERGLGLSLAYPTPINEIAEIREVFEGKRFPSARRVADHLLTIPTHHWLTEKDRNAIVECLGGVAHVIRPSEEWRRAS
jgi:dTDP-4-amino-4,6-dideoxygalactose transaminase